MKIASVLYLLPLLALSGCALSEDLSPPANGKTVKIVVVKPADVDILPMDVIYRSEKCRDKIFTSTGAISSRAGYHKLTVPFKPETDGNKVSNNIALDGGSYCEWKLSNVKFKFKYHDIAQFNSKILEGTPKDIVFAFDNNAPPRGDGHYENVSGCVYVKKDFYPIILKEFTQNGMDVLYIQGQSMLTYRVYDAISVLFNPIFHSEMIVNAIPPKRKGDGYTLIYPNGDRIIDRHFPNSEKTKYEFVKKKSR